jgi:hypothetical protein
MQPHCLLGASKPWRADAQDASKEASGCISIFRLAEGRIAHHWEQLDRLALMQRLGVVPAPGVRLGRIVVAGIEDLGPHPPPRSNPGPALRSPGSTPPHRWTPSPQRQPQSRQPCRAHTRRKRPPLATRWQAGGRGRACDGRTHVDARLHRCHSRRGRASPRSSRPCCTWCGVPSGNSWTPSSWEPWWLGIG